MLGWWATNGPPVYASVAGYLGLVKERPKKGSSTAKPDKPVGGDLNELLKLADNTGMIH